MIPVAILGSCLVLYTIAFTSTLLLIILACVCNPRSKRFHKHKSFILSHDLPIEVPCNNDAHEFIDTNDNLSNKLKLVSLNRALPDIPQQQNANGSNLEKIANLNHFCPIQPIDDADSIYTVANTTTNVEVNAQNHPYARIRNNIQADSSTENDTDDYFEPTIPVISSIQPLIVNNSNSYQPENNDQNVSYVLEPPVLLRANNLDINTFNQISEPKREISYNTISVREPLSKVLVERENIEHHYNEVEDERVSSFYEEITTGSATYSIIDQDKDEDDSNQIIASTSYHMNESAHINNTSLPIYSLVDKKSKRTSCPANNFPPSNILYTKVIKPSPGSTPSKDSKPMLQRYSPPPPLPPPLNKDVHNKLNRNTIAFGIPTTPTKLNQNTTDHQELNQNNIYQKISLEDSNRDPGYECVYRESNHPTIDDPIQCDYGYEAIANDENDPAYEIVKPENGYETIKNQNNTSDNIDLNDESSDPNYEIIPAKVPSVAANSYTNQVTVTVNTKQIKDDNVVIIEHL